MKQWKELFQQEEQRKYYRKLMQVSWMRNMHIGQSILQGRIIHLLHKLPFEAVKVVILGQDPYHQQISARTLFFCSKGRTNTTQPEEYLQGIKE